MAPCNTSVNTSTVAKPIYDDDCSVVGGTGVSDVDVAGIGVEGFTGCCVGGGEGAKAFLQNPNTKTNASIRPARM